MNRDERFELLNSLAADGELERGELHELLDRMAEDPACRENWRRTREFDQLIHRSPSPMLATPGIQLRWIRWAAPLATAAMLALLVALPLSGAFERSEPVATTDASFEVRIAEDSGTMTEPRFVELALELLKSDRHYQRKMADILDDVLPSPVDGDSEGEDHRSRRFAENATFESEPADGELPYEAVASIH